MTYPFGNALCQGYQHKRSKQEKQRSYVEELEEEATCEAPKQEGKPEYFSWQSFGEGTILPPPLQGMQHLIFLHSNNIREDICGELLTAMMQASHIPEASAAVHQQA